MSDWKQQIEAQIRNMEDPHCAYSMRMRFEDAATMQALLDVAVGFETDVEEGLHYMYPETYKALRKLREVSE